jgi:hypothetical protein
VKQLIPFLATADPSLCSWSLHVGTADFPWEIHICSTMLQELLAILSVHQLILPCSPNSSLFIVKPCLVLELCKFSVQFRFRFCPHTVFHIGYSLEKKLFISENFVKCTFSFFSNLGPVDHEKNQIDAWIKLEWSTRDLNGDSSERPNAWRTWIFWIVAHRDEQMTDWGNKWKFYYKKKKIMNGKKW